MSIHSEIQIMHWAFGINTWTTTEWVSSCYSTSVKFSSCKLLIFLSLFIVHNIWTYSFWLRSDHLFEMSSEHRYKCLQSIDINVCSAPVLTQLILHRFCCTDTIDWITLSWTAMCATQHSIDGNYISCIDVYEYQGGLPSPQKVLRLICLLEGDDD